MKIKVHSVPVSIIPKSVSFHSSTRQQKNLMVISILRLMLPIWVVVTFMICIRPTESCCENNFKLCKNTAGSIDTPVRFSSPSVCTMPIAICSSTVRCSSNSCRWPVNWCFERRFSHSNYCNCTVALIWSIVWSIWFWSFTTCTRRSDSFWRSVKRTFENSGRTSIG